MKTTIALCVLGLLACSSCRTVTPKGGTALDYNKINAAASEAYLKPIRAGYEKRNPYWNTFSKKFIYAPAFDFKEVDGASTYLYTITPAEESITGSWSFKADKPYTSLAPVWNSIPVGQMNLTVVALDKNGNSIGTAGERKFLRDYPFTGPYREALRDYRESARMALIFVHGMPEIQHWLKSTEPDMGYTHHTYPCKIIGATIRCEALLAKLLPSYKEKATMIARNAAQFLIDQSQPEGSPLAFWPPTYYKDLIASKYAENQNKTMTMEASAAGHAFLDLFDMTGDSTYYHRAKGIADTYVRLQNADGSWPIKVDFTTGEPINNSHAMLQPLLTYFQRLKADYGIDTYADAQAKAEAWMQNVAVRNFDMTGQFEDVSVMNLRPYENLTNCTAAPYASYLLSKKAPTDQEIADAKDLTHFSEDQFTFWDTPYNADGIKMLATPCVYEQYKYQKPVDNSACNVAEAMLDLYTTTGDKTYLAKSKAIVDNITFVQNPINGQIPTTWDFRVRNAERFRTYWINCTYSSVTMLLKMADVIDSMQ